MRVVRDCNVLVSAARSGGVCGAIVIATVRDCEVVLSRPIADEYRAVAERPAHVRYRDTLLAILGELERVAVFVEPADAAFGLRDAEDEVYLATAQAGEAVLVTGNIRDFTEPRYGSVEVYSPRAFLNRTA